MSGFLCPFMVHHSLFKVLSWALVFHFAAWSERKLSPSLIKEVSGPTWRMFIGERVGTERLRWKKGGAAPFGVFWLSRCHTALSLVSCRGLG